MNVGHTFILVLAAFLGIGILPGSGVLFCARAEANAQPGAKCIECHSRPDNMPGIYNQYLKSKHSNKDVKCLACHMAQKGEPDAFLHYDQWISVIVTPNDCGRCHPSQVNEFNLSAHHNSRILVTEGCGRIIADNLVNTQYPRPNGKKSDKTAGTTTDCLRCHGSKIMMVPGTEGRPTHETWPNYGMARENPDGSIGNCAACHGSHQFSVAQARKPESCAICHNSGGGDPQYDAFLQSRHGMTYHSLGNQMNFDSVNWIAGIDYCAAPTCATCHMSAAPGLKSTHNINERLDWNPLLQKANTLAIKEKCGEAFQTDYRQPAPNPEHWGNMKKVCLACHSGQLAENFKKQYQDGVSLFNTKWLEPGKILFQLAVDVLQKINGKEKYALFTHPIDWAWFAICNSNAKSAKSGAAMMSPGGVDTGTGGAASNWYTGFIPAVEGVIEMAKGIKPKSKDMEDALRKLEEAYNKIKSDPGYSGPWSMEKK